MATRHLHPRRIRVGLCLAVAAMMAAPLRPAFAEDEPPVITLSYDMAALLDHAADALPPRFTGEPLDRRHARAHLANILRDLVNPDQWVAFGGNVSRMDYSSDTFQITAPHADHRRILALLEKLEAAEDVDALDAPEIPTEAEAYRQILYRQITIDWRGKRLADVVAELSDRLDIPIGVHWQDLDFSVGIDRDTPVTLRLTDAPVGAVLQQLAQYAQSAGDVAVDDVSFSLAHGRIYLGVVRSVRRNGILRVYRTEDLLASLFGEDNAAATPERIEQLMDLVRYVVAPNAWQEFGGTQAWLRQLAGRLLIHAPADIHWQIEALFQQLRQEDAPVGGVRVPLPDDAGPKALMQRRVGVQWDHTPLEQAIDDLQRQLGVPIEVDWVWLDRMGVGQDAPLSIAMADAAVVTVLEELTASLRARGDGDVGYHFGWNDLMLGAQLIPGPLPIRAHAVADVAEARFGDVSRDRDEAMHHLTALIRQRIEPAAWDEHGGRTASIRPFGDRLVLRSSHSVQRRVEQLLETMRDAAARP